MSSKTKIVVLKSKELIYTAIFVVLGILLISLLIYMFSPSDDEKKEKSTTDTADISNLQISQNDIIYTTDDSGINTAPDATVIPPQDVTSVSAPAVNSSTDNSPTGEATDNDKAGTYQSGVYSSVLNIGGQTELQLSVTVDNGNVSHIDIINLNEAITAMYPLIEPSLDEINAQLETGASFENLTYSKENQYTTILIIQAAEDALSN